MTPPFLADTRPHHDATELLATFGPAAIDEATARAARSRTLGNHIHFCRWRQVARLLATLGAADATETTH